MSVAAWLNTAWMLKCLPEALAFHRATRRVAQVQANLLADLLRRNRDTVFGRVYGFRSIRGVRDFRKQVPLTGYEDYAALIDRIAAGERNVLTREPVELLEPTSGTTAGEKLIPCTAELRRQFQRAVSAWIADLFRHWPEARRGRAYWSISPALGDRRYTRGGIPIGFEDDAAYLGTLERFALDRLLTVPPAVSRIENLETFRYCTLLSLLGAEDLALVSVWSPTFLPALLRSLERWHESLCHDLAHGTLHPPVPLPAELARCLAPRQAPARASALAGIFRSRLALPEKLRAVWPRLALISCWADAASGPYLRDVRELFPAVAIQPKGLLATEGCVSFPLVGRPAPVLAVRSHFFEFQEGDGEDCRLAHEVEEGGRYRVVLTTAGGLYRYRLGDEVEVAGFENQCPLLRFLGRADRVSDLVGEKLAEGHVRDVLDRLFAAHQLTPRFALLVPVLGHPPRYRLYLQDALAHPAPGLRADLEEGLSQNPYYRHAVRMGQLTPVEIQLLDPSVASAWQVYERRCLERGQRVGNIKPAALDAAPDWPEVFRPLHPRHSSAIDHRSSMSPPAPARSR